MGRRTRYGHAVNAKRSRRTKDANASFDNLRTKMKRPLIHDKGENAIIPLAYVCRICEAIKMVYSRLPDGEVGQMDGPERVTFHFCPKCEGTRPFAIELGLSDDYPREQSRNAEQ